MSKWIVPIVVIIGGISAFVAWRDDTGADRILQDNGLSPSQFIGMLEEDDFPAVKSPWSFRFPADHGPHGRYRTEWWHLAGVLFGDHPRPLGVQLSLVRIGLTARRREHPSGWAATEIYAGLFSISDTDSEHLRTHQRISRGALGLAGSRARPMQVWVENWRLEQTGGGERTPDLKVEITTDDLELDLELQSTQPLIDSSEIERQGTEQPPPFVFYVQPHLSARGTLNVDGQRKPVRGSASMEHAWGELPLPGGPVARDRFTLHLDDGRELFFIRTHSVDGSGAPSVTGLFIDRDGSPLVLSSNAIALEPRDYWKSERANARYPINWTLQIPHKDIELEIAAYSESQEGVGWTPFWGGPVQIWGPRGKPAGYGFVQLNGYDEP